MSKDCALLDRTLFDEFAELFDAAEMRDVIEEWHADVTNALVLIEEALRRGDSAEVARVAHRTAGGGLALGATSLADVCERLRGQIESGAGVTSDDVDRVRRSAEATHRALSDAAGV
ncbi:MAG TPA: Hpt domain-containing protein [Solirubrobacteraceae bacterium]|nr:Hpt domain-containing protein [Solirubrobacteraceae bacterium]